MVSKGNESDWYRRLVKRHGRSKIAVGACPFSTDQAYWVSSTDDDESTAEEHAAFAAGLEALLNAFRANEMPGVRLLDGVNIVGDWYVVRTETLLLPAVWFRSRVDSCIRLIGMVKAYLELPENRRWRIATLAPHGSIVIYPGVVCIGMESFHDLSKIDRRLREWLDKEAEAELAVKKSLE